jgi:hypothetical protein
MQSEVSPARGRRSALGWSCFATAALCLLGAAHLSGWPVNQDSAQYLHIGHQLLAGATPYVDYVETNPPLVHYLHVLPAALTRLGVSLPQAFLILVSALCLYAAYAIAELLSLLGVGRPAERLLVATGWLCLSLLVLCNNGYGQREHLFIVAYGPWLLCRHARHRDIEVRWTRALVLGVLAGSLSLLKPQFLLLPFFAECLLLLRSRRTAALAAPELIVPLLLGLAYALHFALVPEAVRNELFARWLPLLSEHYDAYGIGARELYLGAIGLGVSAAVLVALACWPAVSSRRATRPLLEALILSTSLAALVYFQQSKGWYYHAYPVLGCLVLLLALLLVTRTRAEARQGQRRLLPLVAVGLVATALLLAAFAFRVADRVRPGARVLARYIAENSEAGDTVAFIDSSVAPAYPALLYAERLPGTRYPTAFPIAFLCARDPEAPMLHFERQFLDELGSDILQRRPRMVFVRSGHSQFCPESFRVVSYLGATTGWLDRHLSSYRLEEGPPGYALYVLSPQRSPSPMGEPRASGNR